MNTLYPFLFHHNLFELVWGGHRLVQLKGLTSDDRKIGESWEVSSVPGKESVVSNGTLAGKNLNDLIKIYGENLLGRKVMERYGENFPLLFKIIDAEKDLSIQVHPNDELAQQRHGSMGKSEMWLVLDANPGAYLYSGFNQSVSRYEYSKRVEDGSICEVLERHEVHPGDVFFVPAGRVHAIGAGILLAEIQQSSDITYRIFDYNRLGLDGKPRLLHTEQAIDAIDFHVESDYKTHYKLRKNRPIHAITCPFFQVNLLHVDKIVTRHLRKCDSFVIVCCLSGKVRINIENADSHIQQTTLQTAQSCLIPACLANYQIIPQGDRDVSLIEAFIDNYHPWHKETMDKILSILDFD